MPKAQTNPYPSPHRAPPLAAPLSPPHSRGALPPSTPTLRLSPAPPHRLAPPARARAQLVRLVRASKIYERWQARISLSFATIMVIKCIAAILLSAHWFACIIALQTTLHTYGSTPMRTRRGSSGSDSAPPLRRTSG